MNFKKYNARVGDVVRINESMSLVYEKIADDLGPVWHEVPADGQKQAFEEGTFVSVTPDVWFVYDKGEWRMMTPNEHIEASRQDYLSQ